MGTPPATFVALGDSLAEGWGDTAGGERSRSWNDWVADGLRARNPHLVFVNLGWRGSTVADVLRDQVPGALTKAPDLVTVTVGANDAFAAAWSASDFRERLRTIVRTLTEQGATVAVFAYPRPIIIPGRQQYVARMSEVNNLVREACRDLGAIVLDFEAFAPAQDVTNLSADLVHPNARGYLVLGHAALQRLTEQLESPDR